MSVLFAEGFLAAGYASGIKQSGDLDLSLVCVAGQLPAVAAATFTQNRAAAAPVQVSRQHMELSLSRISSVVLSSGNANAATGEKGFADAKLMCRLVAEELGVSQESVLVCSTGLIGIPMPSEKLVSGIPELVRRRGASELHGREAARAIMTTDTCEKRVEVQGSNFRIGGMAKGAAMLAPNMATMLAILTTDASVSVDRLASALRRAVGQSFNTLVVDGCTSTNDTVICLSSGTSSAVDTNEFDELLGQACTSLAMQMAMDAEGATKCVTIEVRGAKDDSEADIAARKVATSQLVQCSFYGSDPYWGRIASEIGSSGVDFNLDRLDVRYGDSVVASGGVACDFDSNVLAQYMARRELEVVCDLNIGEGRARVITTDLSPGYIEENMRTS